MISDWCHVTKSSALESLLLLFRTNQVLWLCGQNSPYRSEHGVQQFDQSRKWIITEFIHSNSRIYRKFYWRKDGTGKIRYCINPFRTLLSLILNSFLASGDILLSADNHCKQFGPRSGPTDPNHLTIWWCSWNNFLKKLISKNPADDKKACKITQHANCKELNIIEYIYFTLLHTCMFGYIAKCICTYYLLNTLPFKPH